MKSKILVTGANGFVGAALSRKLKGMGLDVTEVVRNASLPGQYPIGDYTATIDWGDALNDVEVIVHLAARVHVMDDKVADPITAYRRINVDATVNLARQAAQRGVKRFVFVSSVKVNGETTSNRPFSSQDVPAPIDAYGISKHEAETALIELSKETGMELVIIRPPLVYGPGVGANFLKLMKIVRRGIPLPFGATRNLRSLVALDNLVDLLVLCRHHANAPGKIFMVSDDCDLSLNDLVRKIAFSMTKKPILIPIPESICLWGASVVGKSAVANRLFGSLQIDIASTKNALNWKPIVGPDAAIEMTVSHFLNSNV